MKRNIGGFSLIQVLISALLFTSLSVITFKIRKQQIELGKSSSYAFESLIIIDKMKTLLSYPNSCATILIGKKPEYSEVKRLIYKDEIAKEGKVFYEESSLNGNVYGSNDVFIRSMFIEGDDGLFSVENGYTLFKVRFEDITSSTERFKTFTFPIHIEVDQNGAISSCFALEGLGSINTSNSIGKWHEESSQLINIETRSVNVGQIEKKGELNIKGSMRLGSKYTKCDKSQYGSIRYGNTQGLLFCNQRELWEKVHQGKSFKLTKEPFSVESKSVSEETSKVTQAEYAFCQVEKSYFTGGRCYALPVEDHAYKSRWKLAADLSNGTEIKCDFSCYK